MNAQNKNPETHSDPETIIKLKLHESVIVISILRVFLKDPNISKRKDFSLVNDIYEKMMRQAEATATEADCETAQVNLMVEKLLGRLPDID